MTRIAMVLIAAACACTPDRRPAGPAPAGDVVPDGRGAGDPAGSVPRVDPGKTAFPGVSPILLEPGVATLFDVSPDETRVLVSREPLPPCSTNRHAAPPRCTSDHDIEVWLVTGGAPAVSLGVRGRRARFSPDGRFVLVAGETPPFSSIARADGSGLRADPGYLHAGPWLYSAAPGGLWRQRDLDETPELFAAFPESILGYRISPDGSEAFSCEVDGRCLLQRAPGAAPVEIPGATWWSASGRWIVAPPCTIYDRAGERAWSCDAASLAEPEGVLLEGDRVMFTVRGPAGFDVHVRDLATGAEVVLPTLPSPPGLVRGGGASVIALLRTSLDPSAPVDPFAPLSVSVLVAPAAGGAWTRLADRIEYRHVDVSPDGRVIAFASPPWGTLQLLSVDRGPVPLGAGEPRLAPLTPHFEPAGGSGRAVFHVVVSAPPGGLDSAVANADGSGEWLWLSSGWYCNEWAGHTAVCSTGDGGDVALVHGDRFGLLDRGVTQLAHGQEARKLYYVTAAGLAVAELPLP